MSTAACEKKASQVETMLGEVPIEAVSVAEAWARLEGDERARSAVEKLREGAEGMS